MTANPDAKTVRAPKRAFAPRPVRASKAALFALGLALGLPLPPAAAEDIPPAPPETVDAVVKASFTRLPEGWAPRLVQDETQRACSLARNAPPPAQAEAIMKREAALVKYPADGVMGDWKRGEKVAQSGRGGQFSDGPGTVNGGNCYACHQLAPSEVSYGTLGPSLTNYGRDRKFAPEDAKAAYAKIYDAQAVYACSNMPRFGVHGFLTEEQMKDVVAFLFDPASPVNQPAK